MTPDWTPFLVCQNGRHAQSPRSIHSPEGIGDRLRAAAFAEIQAREAFNWAAGKFNNVAPDSLISAWKGLALAEDKHLKWLLERMAQIKQDPGARRVSDRLWYSFVKCESPEEFAVYMANAEERGRIAGERFFESILEIDAISAEIFRKIAEEELEHIRLAQRFFNNNSGINLPNEIAKDVLRAPLDQCNHHIQN